MSAQNLDLESTLAVLQKSKDDFAKLQELYQQVCVVNSDPRLVRQRFNALTLCFWSPSCRSLIPRPPLAAKEKGRTLAERSLPADIRARPVASRQGAPAVHKSMRIQTPLILQFDTDLQCLLVARIRLMVILLPAATAATRAGRTLQKVARRGQGAGGRVAAPGRPRRARGSRRAHARRLGARGRGGA
jgi:hypothetical protein